MFRVLLFLLVGLFYSSCSETIVSTTAEFIPSNTNLSLSKIHFYDNENGFIVGGDLWEKGICLQTKDGGESWKLDSLADKKLLGLAETQETQMISVGVDGYFFHKEIQDEEWKFQRLTEWDVLRDVVCLPQGGYVCVGGAGLSTGVIYLMNSNFEIDSVFSFEQEFRSIVCPKSDRCFAVGFGHVVELSPLERTTRFIPVEGDLFQDIQFIDDKTGYILGTTGSIYKTVNGGESWEEIHKTSSYTSGSDAYRSIYFLNEQIGYRAGDKGIIELTKDGAMNWTRYDIDFSGQLNDIVIVANQIFVISEHGNILKLDTLH